MRPGDWLCLLLAAGAVGLCFATLWRGGAADHVVVRANGTVFAKLPLDVARVIEVPGPLGITRVEIAPGRARVASDPGPRQYCVRQGWLREANAVAICAPNQVSLTLEGRSRPYDSLVY